MNLEKFCIVKRRRQGLENPFPSFLPFPEEEPPSGSEPNLPVKPNRNGEEEVLSIPLTPEQSRVIRSGGILPLLETKTPKTFHVDLKREADGVVVFNFHLNNFMMLNPMQVCQMMQISRSLLNRMVLEKKIKSYKIGRLRRFFLNDILENLKQHQTENQVYINIEVG